jgi:hypothetical protein
MTRRAKIMPPPENPGRPDGWTPTSEADHFEKCPTCGHLIDCRDLAEVMEHEGPAFHLPQTRRLFAPTQPLNTFVDDAVTSSVCAHLGARDGGGFAGL